MALRILMIAVFTLFLSIGLEKEVYSEIQVTFHPGPDPIDQEINEYLTRPDWEIDIAKAALLITKKVNPDIDVDACLAQYDKLAGELYWHVPITDFPVEIYQSISRFILWEKHFPVQRKDPDNSFEKIGLRDLENEEGNCFPLTILYMALGQRLGYQTQMSLSPRHAMVRCMDTDDTLFVEATASHLIYPGTSFVRAEYPHQFFQNLDNRRTAAAVFNQYGIKYSNQKDLLKAREFWEQANTIDPGLVIALTNTASAQLDAGEIEEALETCEKALEVAPGNADVLYIMGRANWMRNKFTLAVDALRQSVDSDPEKAHAFYLLGMSLTMQDKKEEAETAFQKSLSLKLKQPVKWKATYEGDKAWYKRGTRTWKDQGFFFMDRPQK